MKIDGVVVLYNPKDELFENIGKYLPLLNHLFVMDNSSKVNENFVSKLKELKNVTYVSLNGNQGIAKALKEGLV